MSSAAAYAVSTRTLLVLLPEFLLIAAAVAMMTAGAFMRVPRRVWSASSAVVMVVALLVLRMLWNFTTDPYSAVALNDALSGYARVAFLITGLILLAIAHDQVDDARAAEFFGSLLLINAGAMLVVAANDMVLLFVGLELVSIPTYLILYLPQRNSRTLEAATKYFYLSIFSSALFLFGLAYLYGLTGVSNLRALSFLFRTMPHIPVPFGVVAVVFVMAGLGFRVAAVPFHFYAPDVYQGAPTAVTALLAWVPKAVGFVAILRVLTAVVGGLNGVSEKGMLLAWVIAVVTMTLGNTVALSQQNLKRLFAYSSIAHAGYLMVGVAAAFRNVPSASTTILGAYGIMFYLAAYALMTLGAFAVIVGLSTPDRPVETIDDLTGLGQTHPLMALAMSICLFSLAGVPPLAGFWGKFWIFGSALEAARGDDARLFQVLTVIGVVNAAVGAYYYLRIVVKMILLPAAERLNPCVPWPTRLAIATCAGCSLYFGIFPGALSDVAQRAAVAAVDRSAPAAVAVAGSETEPPARFDERLSSARPGDERGSLAP